jgi:hypothetical protein
MINLQSRFLDDRRQTIDNRREFSDSASVIMAVFELQCLRGP